MTRVEFDDQPGASNGRSTPEGTPGPNTPARHIRFSTELDIVLLREVVRYGHPFRRGSVAWERIANTIAKTENLPGISARTVRERAERLVRKQKMDNKSIQRQ